MTRKRYIVGTRDTAGRYRALRIDNAATISDAKIAAVSRLENDGVYAIATTCYRINESGQRIAA